MRATILALLIALAAGDIEAQRYNFKLYGEEEGLRNLAVQVILQDRAGFVWVGTQNGLFRYDGGGFSGFGIADGLPGARIEALHESADGTLWVATQAGLARRKGDRFDAVATGVDGAVSSRTSLASDSSGRLYVATSRGLVVGTRAANRDFRFHLVPRAAAIVRDDVSTVYVDSRGAVWYGCADSLCVVETAAMSQTGTETGREIGTQSGLPAGPWRSILGDLDGNLWARSDRLLYECPMGSHRFQARPKLPDSTYAYPTLALDPAGRLLVPTSKGLARESNDGWEIIDAEQGLPSNDIASVMQDREGAIWLGFLGSGLARWLGYNEWQGWTDREGLSRESVWSMVRDPFGKLWVGTQGGLNYAEEKSGRLNWRVQPVAGMEIIRALAVSMPQSGAGPADLWIGGSPGGLRKLNLRTMQLRAIGAADGFPSNNVRHLMVDRDGSLWASTRDGLFRKTPGSTRFEQVDVTASSSAGGAPPPETFHMTMQDTAGTVWAAGAQGLARFAGGRWTRFTTRNGLKSDVVAHVAEDPDGAIWISYYDAFGLTRITFPQGQLKLEHFGSSSGLRSDKSIFLGFDARGWLWAGSDHGVDVFDHTRWRHYGKSDGLIWDDCDSNAFLSDANGGVWIGTSRGLSRFRPLSSPAPSVPPPVVFTSVKLGDQAADPSAAIEVPYRRHSLQVRFAALTFMQESGVLFRYRLAGATSHWLETTQPELNYPGLSPGQYALEVTARNAQGVWSAEPARLQFRILSPWWLAWWLQALGTFTCLMLARVMWQRRTYRLHMDKCRLEKAVAERTLELSLEKQRVLEEKARTEQQNREIERLLHEAQQASRSKSEFLANVSHEIRTPMNGVIGMTDLVLATPLTPEQREYLATARLSANSLLTVLNDVLDFSKIEAGKLDLNPIDFSLRQCVHETAKMFSVAAAEKQLAFEIQIDSAVPDRVTGDPDRLRQVLLNLSGNAIKFTSKGGVWINVSVEEDGEVPLKSSILLHFVVRDTGIGIPDEKRGVIFEAFRQADGSTTRKYGGTGLGLAICSRLVEMMGGSIRVESEVGSGSSFHFTARFGQAAVAENVAAPDPASLRKLLKATGESASPKASLRILIAEDNAVNQRVAARLLEKRGHRVVLAGSGREALECLNHEPFDVILMDVQMPEMDGLEATRVIRERETREGSHIPIVALTAHAMGGDRERCLAAGMDDYVNKPIDAVKLLEVVERLARAGSPAQDATGA